MSDVALIARAVLAKPTCVVGVGNPWRNDDAVGVNIAKQLLAEAFLPPQIQVLNVEDVIESYVFDIAQRAVQNVVLVDAVASPDLPLGSVLFGKVCELESSTCELSTHKLALSTVESVFRQAGKETYLLGIVAANTDFGQEMSPEVKAAEAQVVDIICAARSNN